MTADASECEGDVHTQEYTTAIGRPTRALKTYMAIVSLGGEIEHFVISVDADLDSSCGDSVTDSENTNENGHRR